MDPGSIFTLLGVGFFAFFVGIFALHRVMERRARVDERPARRRRLRAWAEKRGGSYEEDVDVPPSEKAHERVQLTVDDLPLEIATFDGPLASAVTRVSTDDPHGRSRRGAIRRHAGDTGRARRKKPPFDRDFAGDGDALPDEKTKRLVLRLEPYVTAGTTVLEWRGARLMGRIKVHAEPGPALDALIDLVCHVAHCQEE